MGPVTYAVFAYALTAVISYVVVAIIVLINRMMSKKAERKEG